MTYEEMVAQCGLPPYKNMWGQQCRSDLLVNQEPVFEWADVVALPLAACALCVA